MKKLTSLWLALLFLLAPLTGCAQDTGVTGSADGPTEVIVSDSESLSGAGTDGSITDGPTSALVNDGTGSLTEAELGPAVTGTETLSLGNTVLEEEGSYTSRDTVALYLMKYGTLPQKRRRSAGKAAPCWNTRPENRSAATGSATTRGRCPKRKGAPTRNATLIPRALTSAARNASCFLTTG